MYGLINVLLKLGFLITIVYVIILFNSDNKQSTKSYQKINFYNKQITRDINEIEANKKIYKTTRDFKKTPNKNQKSPKKDTKKVIQISRQDEYSNIYQTSLLNQGEKKGKKEFLKKLLKKIKRKNQKGLTIQSKQKEYWKLSLNERIKSCIDYTHPEVRNFALTLTNTFKEQSSSYPKYRTIIQSLAIFKAINNNWNYVHDPYGVEYFAKASETVNHLSGDCDDHSILMAACIRSVSGEVRLVHTKGHIYPELKIGKDDDLKNLIDIIKNELFKEFKISEPLHYHIDNENFLWLNLDYTRKFPGGPFYAEEIHQFIY